MTTARYLPNSNEAHPHLRTGSGVAQIKYVEDVRQDEREIARAAAVAYESLQHRYIDGPADDWGFE